MIGPTLRWLATFWGWRGFLHRSNTPNTANKSHVQRPFTWSLKRRDDIDRTDISSSTTHTGYRSSNNQRIHVLSWATYHVANFEKISTAAMKRYFESSCPCSFPLLKDWHLNTNTLLWSCTYWPYYVDRKRGKLIRHGYPWQLVHLSKVLDYDRLDICYHGRVCCEEKWCRQESDHSDWPEETFGSLKSKACLLKSFILAH